MSSFLTETTLSLVVGAIHFSIIFSVDDFELLSRLMITLGRGDSGTMGIFLILFDDMDDEESVSNGETSSS